MSHGNLHHTADSTIGAVAFDTGTAGTISGEARPYVLDDTRYFVARLGDAASGTWNLYAKHRPHFVPDEGGQRWLKYCHSA